VGGLIALAACWLGVSTPAWLQFLHYRVFDVITAPGNPAIPSGLPVIVDIDERSLKAHGRWPWPRDRVADLIERLQASAPLAIALDMVFPEPEAAGGAAGSDGDRRLAAALSASRVVLGFQFEFEGACEKGACLGRPLALPQGAGRDAGLIRACGAACSLPGLADAARAGGFFNVAPDPDGLLRSVPLVIEHDGRLYPSLALAVWLEAVGASPSALVRHAGDIHLRVGSARVPLESGGRLRLGFRGPGRRYPYVSADDVLTGRVAPERLRGRIVFVGTSAVGLKEYRSTPTDPLFPGVEVHATVVDNIMTGEHPVRPAYAPALELAAALLTGMITVVLFGRGRALRLLSALALGAWILWGGAVWAFAAERVLLSPVLPLLVLVAEFSGLSLLRFWSEERRGRERARELALAQEAIIECMASLTETRDPETGGHIKRTQHYVRILARALGRTRQGGAATLSEDAIDLLYKSAPLHDIGKVGVPDHILLKPGRLDADEFELMKRHTVYGHDAICAAMRKLANGSFLQTACDIAISHHERWDGRGYPRGLRGEDIPLAGRLMALADTYDALISRRVYKPPMTHDAAVGIILESSGSQFDPALVETFLAVAEEFRRVAEEYADRMDDERAFETPSHAACVSAPVAPRARRGTASPA
jgi:adenylate cyclase